MYNEVKLIEAKALINDFVNVIQSPTDDKIRHYISQNHYIRKEKPLDGRLFNL